MHPVVTQRWLRENLADSGLRLVDCRYEVGRPAAGREAYLAGHLPGAAYLDVHEDLSGTGGSGRHPLPTAEEFATAARSAGIGAGSTIVAYDQRAAGGAARLWWLLRHFGHGRVAVLEGGIHGWTGPLQEGVERIPPGDFVSRERHDTVDHADVLAHLGEPGRLLLDARAPERYRGEVEPLDPVAGHIPGARNLPFTQSADLPSDVVDGGDDIVVYCGSGVTACVVLLNLEARGRTARLYPGSWSDWSDRGLPIATGDEPDPDQT
ncbi:MAG: sulfurtransferase [Nitriliruptorales bacterium]|nr:sulfurtransferase [Nitriliruptorales bacterium]